MLADMASNAGTIPGARQAYPDLEGKVALVTGAGSGIGRAAAVMLAKTGVRVGLLGRTEPQLVEAAREIEAAGGEAHVLTADIADPRAVEGAVARLVQRTERLDIVFANAGVNGLWAPLEDLTPEDFQKTLAINLNGTFYTIKYAAPHLKRRGGSIVVTSSVNGTRMFSNTGATAYACSKAAQVALVKMLAVELAKQRVRVNVICPGAIDTEIEDNTQRQRLEQLRVRVEYPEGQIPLTGKQPGTAAQVAELVLFLASERTSHVTGTEIWIDGAQSLLQG